MNGSAIRTEAVLLRSADYREADRIVTLLTPDHGRVSAIARGARSSRKRFAGALEPFSLVEIVVQMGQRGLYRLDEARITRAFHGLLADLKRMEEAGRCLEAIRAYASEETSERQLFDETCKLLGALDNRPAERLVVVRLCFWARLLELVGLGPDLQRCGGCGKQPGIDQPAQFDALRGHLVCRNCGGAATVLSATARHAWIAAAEGGVDVEPRLKLAEPTIQHLDETLASALRAHAP